MDKTERIAQLRSIALQLAQETHYRHVTLKAIAERAGVTHPLVSNRLGTMTNIRRDILRDAIKEGNVVVLAQGLADRERIALKAPPELQARARAMQEQVRAAMEAA